MIRTAQYNNFSEKFQEDLKKACQLKQGQVVEFELLNIKPDPNNPGKLLIPASKNIPSTDRVYDKHDEQWKDAALIRGIGQKGEVQFGRILFKIQNRGRISLRGGNAADQEIYEYLMISNYRSNNKLRDKSRVPMFKLINPVEDAKTNTANRKQLVTALTMAEQMTDEESVQFSAVMGWDYSAPIAVLKDKAGEYAQANPDGFLMNMVRKDKEMVTITRMAIDNGVIEFNVAESTFTWPGSREVITTVPRITGMSPAESFVAYALKEDRGMATYKAVKETTLKKVKSKV